MCTAHHAAGGNYQWDYERHLGVFVMQHNHTKATHGNIDDGDVISDVVICLTFKRHQRSFFFAVAQRHVHGMLSQVAISN